MVRIMKYAMLVCCIGLFSSVLNAATSVQQAISDYHQGDFESAIYQFQQILDQPASEQTATASFMLGKMVERGEGFPIDDQIALSYYKKSAALGYTEAEQRLQEFSGNDESNVQDWYMEAAWDGDANAQYSLGYLYETGTGIRIDNARAIQWYEEASKKQHKNAQFRLGLLLIGAETEFTNIKAGKYWIRAAAENGNQIASAIVKRLFEKVDENDILQTLRGIRTFEQSSFAEMIAVIDNTFVTPQIISSSNATKNKQKPVVKPEKTLETIAGFEDKILLFFKTEINKLRIASASIYSSSDYRFVILPVVVLLLFLFWFFHRGNDKEKPEVRLLPPSKSAVDSKAYINDVMPVNESSENTVESSNSYSIPFSNRETIIIEPLTQAKRVNPDVIIASGDLSDYQSDQHDVIEAEDSEYVIGHEVFLPADMGDITLGQSIITSNTGNDESPLGAHYDDSGLVVDYVPPSELLVESIDEIHQKTDEEKEGDDLLAESYYNIGMMFVTGEGVAKNVPHGMGWLQRSAEKGHILAEFELDILCEEQAKPTKKGVVLSFAG